MKKTIKKQFVIIGNDILGNIHWSAAPTLKEAAAFMRSHTNSGEGVDGYLYIGTGKIKVTSKTKMDFSDVNGKVICLGKGFNLTDLALLE